MYLNIPYKCFIISSSLYMYKIFLSGLVIWNFIIYEQKIKHENYFFLLIIISASIAITAVTSPNEIQNPYSLKLRKQITVIKKHTTQRLSILLFLNLILSSCSRGLFLCSTGEKIKIDTAEKSTESTISGIMMSEGVILTADIKASIVAVKVIMHLRCVSA